MLANRVRRHLLKLEREARPVRRAGIVDGDDEQGSTRPTPSPAERSKIETILGKLLPLLPRGRKVRILDLCNGESTC